ncbi:MAG TPA: zinc ribbon domain-containing protein [Gemmatimonadales bacterium]|nr:zinc ribbon domain-containing protein [Gemmatimonadales bacterium]
MVLEAALAAVLGLAILWIVFQPLARPGRGAPRPAEPLDPEETPRGVALTALREIEFDRATGKLSDADYEDLKARYTTVALAALRAEAAATGPADVEAMIAGRVRSLRSAGGSTPSPAPECPACGPRPEADAVFCSACGVRLEPPAWCEQCGAMLPAHSRFCELCGTRVAA